MSAAAAVSAPGARVRALAPLVGNASFPTNGGAGEVVPSDATEVLVTNVEPSANWRPGARWRARKSVPHTIAGIGSMLRSCARRDDFDTPDLRPLDALRHELDAALVLAVRNLRKQGVSWQQIANELGTSKANVVQRWAKRVQS